MSDLVRLLETNRDIYPEWLITRAETQAILDRLRELERERDAMTLVLHESGWARAEADLRAEHAEQRAKDWQNAHGKVAHDLDIMRGKRDAAEQRVAGLEAAIVEHHCSAISLWCPMHERYHVNQGGEAICAALTPPPVAPGTKRAE